MQIPKKAIMTALLASHALSGTVHAASQITSDMIVNAWKSDAYYQSLTPGQRAQIPQNPAGQFQLLSGFQVAQNMAPQGTCDHGCPCTTYQMNCSGTSAMDCSNTSAMDCSNTSAMDCCNTGCMDC